MPRLIAVYIRQVLVGFALAIVFVGMLLGFNVANLGHLVRGSDVGGIALIMLVVFNGIVFAGVQFGITIMRMGEDTVSGGGRRAPRPVAQPTSRLAEVPATVAPKADVLRRGQAATARNDM